MQSVVDRNIQRLHARDSARLLSLWNDKHENNPLPQVPPVELVLRAIHEHARAVVARAMPLLERQLQELISIKHLDPWVEIVSESGIQTHITKALRASIIDASKLCRPGDFAPHLTHPQGVDYFCLAAYISLVVLLIPIICIHFLVRPIPPTGIQYMALCWCIALSVASGFHTYVHAGKSVLSEKKTCLVEHSWLCGLSSLHLDLDAAARKTLKPHVSSETAVITWPEIRLDVAVRFSCAENTAESMCFRVTLAGVSSTRRATRRGKQRASKSRPWTTTLSSAPRRWKFPARAISGATSSASTNWRRRRSRRSLPTLSNGPS